MEIILLISIMNPKSFNLMSVPEKDNKLTFSNNIKKIAKIIQNDD